MRKKKLQRSTTRNLRLPVWLKLRMNDGLMNQVEWMINGAEKCDAGSVTLKFRLKNRPWKISLQVKRIHDNKH